MGRRIICSRIGRKLLNIAQQAVLTEDGVFKLKLKTLCILMGKDNIPRVKTQITQRDDGEDFRYPLLLHWNHGGVKRLVRERHFNLHVEV